MAYRKVISILILCLLPCAVWATSETLRPDSADVEVGAGWAYSTELNAYELLGDNNDATYMYMYDNNNVGSRILVCMANPSSSDTLIDTVWFYVRWRTDNVGNQPAEIDTTDGETLTETPYSTATTDTWTTDSTMALELPSRVAYDLSKLTSTIIGVSAYTMNNNKQLDIADIWAVVISHNEATGGAYQGQIISIGGD